MLRPKPEASLEAISTKPRSGISTGRRSRRINIRYAVSTFKPSTLRTRFPKPLRFGYSCKLVGNGDFCGSQNRKYMSPPNEDQIVKIGAQPLELDQLASLAHAPRPLALAQTARARIRRCHEFLQTQLARTDRAFYGINTGFGALCKVRISNSELEALQHNLVVSHACGTGEEVPAHIVRLMLVLKACNLAQGYSGVREAVVDRLLDMYCEDVLPVVYEQGSLGASGDLAPLAHLSLPLPGLGEVYWKGKRMPAADALQGLGWHPLTLAPKEGLALLNGTQFSQAYAVWCVAEARRLAEAALMTAALACDAFDGLGTPFDARLHAIRPHAGQVRAAARLRYWLEDSPLQRQPKAHVQDPYAFRCMPQVAGASLDAIEYVAGVVRTEVNAVTDNPSLFPDSEAILSGGNFHAQPLALALDFLAIALAELGSISERRTFQLLSGQRGLPPFLTPEPGLNSGLMIPQYTAASIASQNKQLCTPASVDSIVSSNGQEDHVSMAANAATKALRVLDNTWQLIGIEWLTACQALHLRRPARTSPRLEAVVARFREKVPPLENDRLLQPDLIAARDFLREQAWAC